MLEILGIRPEDAAKPMINSMRKKEVGCLVVILHGLAGIAQTYVFDALMHGHAKRKSEKEKNDQ
jgi:hypothetical protein